MGIIAHQQLKKTGLSEGKQMIDQLKDENLQLRETIDRGEEKYKDEILPEIQKLALENKKLKAAVKKLEKENEKLKNPPIWTNEGEL